MIIDTDPGLGFPWADVDDNLAVLFALACDGLTVRLISVVDGNTRSTEGVASLTETLTRVGRRVPIAAGRSEASAKGYGARGQRPGAGSARSSFVPGRDRMAASLGERARLPPHGSPGVGWLSAVPRPGEPLRAGAARSGARAIEEGLPDPLTAFVRLLEGSHESVTLLCLGPLTNVARLVGERPDLLARIDRFVIMGGAIGRPGNVTPEAEYNLWADPGAAAVVFEAPVRRVLVPLDLTMTVAVSLQEVEEALPGRSAFARYLIEGIAAWTTIWEQLEGSAAFVPHDPLAAAYLVDPSLFTVETMEIAVDARSGRTTGRRTSAGETLVCTGVDGPRFKRLFLSALARCASDGATSPDAARPERAEGIEAVDRGASLELFDGARLLFMSTGRWLHPLFELERFLVESGTAPDRLLVRDRIVGKAAALLIARLGIRRVHARTVSRLALPVLASRGIELTYELLVDRIDCATEELLRSVDDEESAYRMVAERAGRGPRRAESVDGIAGG